MSENRASLALPLAAVALILAASAAYYLRAQLFVFETVDYLPHFLGHAPLWKKVFDPFSTDLEQVYRARELANLFNYLDAAFLESCALRGFPHTASIVHYAGLLALSVLHLAMCRRLMPGRTAFASLLLLLLFLLTPAAFLWGTYFRTSKLLAGLCLAVCGWLLAALGAVRMPESLRESVRGSAGLLSALFVSSSLMGLVDEQGVFFLGVLLCCVFAASSITSRKNETAAFLALAGGMCVRYLYKFAVGPLLIHAATGRWVDLLGGAGAALDLLLLAAFAAAGALTAARELSGPGLRNRLEGAARRVLEDGGGRLVLCLLACAALASAWAFGYPLWKGFLSLLDTTGFYFGNTGRFAGACILLLGAAAAPWAPADGPPVESRGRGFLLFVLCAAAAMNAIMIKKHPAVFFADVGRVYYPFPASVLLLMLGTFVLGAVGKRRPAALKPVSAALCLLAVSSALAVPGYKRVLTGGFFKRAFELNPTILECIRRPETDIESYGLSPGAKRHCLIFRGKAPQGQ